MRPTGRHAAGTSRPGAASGAPAQCPGGLGLFDRLAQAGRAQGVHAKAGSTDGLGSMRAGCRHLLACERDPRATLRALAERAPSNDEVDLYGERALAGRLEARVAELLGKEAAVWMPSGTMAQQIALRIH
jgi:hypothetical protein